MDRAEVVAIREKDVRLKQVGRRIVGYCGHVPEHIYYDRDRIDVPIHAEHPDKVALRAKKNAAATIGTINNNSSSSSPQQQQQHQHMMRGTFNGSQVRAAGASTMVSQTGSSIAFSPTQSMGPKHAAHDNTDDILASLAFPSRNINNNNKGSSVSPARGGGTPGAGAGSGSGGGGPVYIEHPRTPVEKLTPFPRYPVLRGPTLMTPSGLTNFLTN